MHTHTHTYTVLTEEQKQNVGMFIDPVTKFFEVMFCHTINMKKVEDIIIFTAKGYFSH